MPTSERLICIRSAPDQHSLSVVWDRNEPFGCVCLADCYIAASFRLEENILLERGVLVFALPLFFLRDVELGWKLVTR